MSDPRIDEALVDMQAGRWPEAAARLESVLDEQPQEPRALRLLGTMHHVAGRHEAAAALLERSAAAAPDEPDTCINLGSVYLALGRTDDAIRSFEQALALQPGALEATFNLAVALQRAGRNDEAERHYRDITAAAPDYVDAWINLAALLLARGDYQECETTAAAGLEHDAQSFRLHALRGRALRDLGRYDEGARHVAEARRLAPDDAHVALEEAHMLAAAGRLTDAAEAYRGVFSRAPDLAAGHLEFAQVLSDLDRHEEAIEALEALARRSPGDARAWSMLGRMRQERGDAEGSLEAHTRAVSAAPQVGAAHAGMAAALIALGRDEDADRELQRAIELDPRSAHAHVARSQLAMRRGAYDAALEVCDRYLAVMPAERSMLAVRGMLLQQLDRAAEARRLLDVETLLQTVTIDAPAGYADLDAFNAALAAHVRGHPSLSPNRTRNATRGGHHTGNLLVEPKGPFADFERLLWTHVARYMESLTTGGEHPFLRAPPDLVAINCWSVVMQRAGHQVPHIHPAGWLSGVYYPELPAAMADDDSREGWIAFGQPPADLPLTVETERHMVRPRTGLLLLFPSYFYHHTVPFDADQERMSIAFDVLPATSG